MTIERIESEAHIQAGIRALRRRCRVMRAMHDAAGTPPLRLQQPGFEGLARIIVGQQLSVQSAAAIWGRCHEKLQPFGADRVMRAREATLKAAGLSAPKIRTLRATAQAVRSGALELAPGAYPDDDTLREAMLAVTGIGPWTADIYIMFSLGRPDAFAAGDLALQIGAQLAYDLPDRPKPDELVELAEAWRPWRGVAARLLWRYYGHVKTQKSAVPV